MDIVSGRGWFCRPTYAADRQLPGGERRRVALCMALLKSRTCCFWTNRQTTWTPKRSNGLNPPCGNTTGTVIIVTHDRYFLDNITKWILELDNGRGLPFEGQLSSWTQTEGRPAAGY